MADPLDPGQISLTECCKGHPLAVKALRELRRDAKRYRWLRINSTQPAEGWSTHPCPESLDAAIDEALE